MFKIIKLGIISIIILVLTGCEVSYNISIDNNLKVSEVLIGLENNVVLEENGETKQKQVKYIIDTLDQIGELFSYTKVPIYNTNTSGVSVKRDFNNIADFNTNSTIAKEVFTRFKVTTNNKQTRINAVANYLSQTTASGTININTINIQVPYAVINNNADSIDKKDHIYTWKLSADNAIKTINITYATDKDYAANNTIAKIINNQNIFLALIAIILIAVGVIWIIVQNKNNNKI